MRLWIGNLAPETTEEELRAFLAKYGVPPFTAIRQVPGDGSRPGVLVTFADLESEKLYAAALRLDGLYWKSKVLNVLVVLH